MIDTKILSPLEDENSDNNEIMALVLLKQGFLHQKLLAENILILIKLSSNSIIKKTLTDIVEDCNFKIKLIEEIKSEK